MQYLSPVMAGKVAIHEKMETELAGKTKSKKRHKLTRVRRAQKLQAMKEKAKSSDVPT